MIWVSCALALSACAVDDDGNQQVASATQALKHLPQPKSDADWPMAQYDVVASSHNRFERKLKRGNIGELEVKWRFDSTDTDHEVGPIHATPVVDKNTIYVGSNLGRFYAITEDGDLKWSYLARQPNPFLAAIVVPSPIGSPIEAEATPIVGAAVLPEKLPYVIFGDLDGNLYALNRKTGAEVWVTHANDHVLGGVVGNSLLLVGDTLIAGFASIENLGLVLGGFGYVCCSHRGFVGAYDIKTGQEKWRTYLVEPAAPLPAAFAPYQLGPSGADVWGQPTYDADTGTLYVGTGQNFSPTAQGGGTSMSDRKPASYLRARRISPWRTRSAAFKTSAPSPTTWSINMVSIGSARPGSQRSMA